MKNPLTPAGIESATFRFVAQHLNHCATAVPTYSIGKGGKWPGVNKVTHPHVVLRLRMSGTLPPLPPNALAACAGTTSSFFKQSISEASPLSQTRNLAAALQLSAIDRTRAAQDSADIYNTFISVSLTSALRYFQHSKRIGIHSHKSGGSN